MSSTKQFTAPVAHPERFFIGGEWVRPSSDQTIEVLDSATGEHYFSVAEAQEADMRRAIAAAHEAFYNGPWPHMSHGERAGYMRALAAEFRNRGDVLGEIWPRESGVLSKFAAANGAMAADTLDYYASLADTYPWEEERPPTSGGEFGLLVREPVGVVGAIVPWNGPLGLISYKIAPALIAGCTVVVKSSPEAPGEGYIVAEAAETIGLPPGVLNFVTADREVSELLVRDPRVDKITFTGSTAAGRRIGSICGERVARCTLELGGKSAAVVLDDIDLEPVAMSLSQASCLMTGQVCSALTRVVVTRNRHDDLLEALRETYSAIRVGDPFDPESDMGPLAVKRQQDRVLGYVAKGIEEGAELVTGGNRPKHLDRGWFVEPTVFGNVENSSAIAQEEIFGPVLTVIPADDEQDAIRIANDTIYGLNASVFTNDVDRARAVSRELRSGTVGHNAWRTDFGIAFGGFKQSGIGREGGTEGLLPFLESKTVILEGRPQSFR